MSFAGSAERLFPSLNYSYVPVIKPRLCQLAFALLTSVSAIVACSVDSADMAASTCSGLNCGSLGEQPPSARQDVPGSLSNAPDASTEPLPARTKPACGAGSCLPDDANACVDHTPEAPAPIADAGARDAGMSASARDAGADAGGEGPAVDGSFDQPEPTRSEPPQYACQLATSGNGLVARGCAPAGSQQAEQACTSSADCAPGLGCVGAARSGRCLPFCCGEGPDSCAPGFFCAERPLRSEAVGEAGGPLVPVCDRADNCSLGESKDCTGPGCVCGPEMVCALVRPDRTTACVPLSPMAGQAGERCPCDRGHHCSQATDPATCVKTCDLDVADSDTCGSGVCQATPVLPAGWGICVGATPDQMTSP